MASKMSWKSYVAAGLVAAVMASAGWADVIELQGGQTISGTIQRQGGNMVIKADDGRVLVVKPEEVVRVTLTSTVTPEQAAEAEWTRAAASIRRVETLAEVIKIHEDFIAKYPDQKATGAVRTSLEEYRKLEKQEGVKYRGNWVPRAQVEVLMRKAQEAAAPAVAFYKAGRMKEALEAVQAAVKQDDENAAALAVGGMAAYRLNNLTLARQYFSKLAEVDSGSVLAHNNLAVVAFQQKREAEALLAYTRALAAAPENRLLLDNITEALNSFKGDRNSAAYKDLIRQFDQAELRMEAAMAKKGLYRFGSTWVPQDQVEKATQQSKAIKDQMAKLDAQYREAMQIASTIDNDIKQAGADYESALSDVNYFNLAILQAQQRGDATAYLATRRDARLMDMEKIRRNKAALEEQRTKLQAALPQFKVEAEKLKLALASIQTGQFSGIQRIMDLGDGERVPPPAALNVQEPKVLVPSATQPQGEVQPSLGDMPVSRDVLEIEMFNTYRQVVSPVWVPGPYWVRYPRN